VLDADTTAVLCRYDLRRFRSTSLHEVTHGQLRFDLANLHYVDVAGMRAQRGRR